MSTPRSLELPSGAQPRRIVSRRLDHAALVAAPLGPCRGTAVLVPGFTGSKEDFLSVLEPLAAAGFEVVTFDQRGQYETGTDDTPLDDILPVLADDLLALIDAIDSVSPGGPVHLVGHSMGGLVCRAATIGRPDVVASLTLLCSGPAALPEDQWPLLQALVAALESVGLEQVWEAKEMIDRANEVAPPPPDIHKFLHERFVRNSPAAVRAKALLLMSEPDRCDDLARAAVAAGTRLQVITGSDDDAWPVDLQATMASTLGAGHTIIAGAGHSPAVDDPHATADALVGFWGLEG